MDSAAKIRVSEYYGERANPQTVPKHIVKFFDTAAPVFKVLATYNTIPRQDWAMMAFFADQIHQLEKRLAVLEGQPEEVAPPTVGDIPKPRRGRPPKVAALAEA